MESAKIEEIRSVHQALFGELASIPTPLTPLPALAAEIGVREVYLKDESTRLGMGAFKVLGASWAICSLLAERYKVKADDIAALRVKGQAEGLTIYAATAGQYLSINVHSRTLTHADVRLRKSRKGSS
jgi:diaminopropionate ammonia-lyase